MLRKKRWQLVFLLFLAGVVNYLDRSALSVAAPLVTRDLDLSPSDLGLIFSSFFVGYAIFNFIGGWASDKLGGKRVFTLAMGVWSAILRADRCGHRLPIAVGYSGFLRGRRGTALLHYEQGRQQLVSTP
jgi:MFS family permease